jgi:hypothetical protein
MYLIELRAIYKAREFFQGQKCFTSNEIYDLHTKEVIINNLLKEIEPSTDYFNKHNLLKIEFRV